MTKLELKENIYKAYKHGNTIENILEDFNINLKQFIKIMYNQGEPGFHPSLFDKEKMCWKIG